MSITDSHTNRLLSRGQRIPAFVKLAPGVSTALLPKMMSSFACTAGVKPAGVCAATRAAWSNVSEVTENFMAAVL
jgi:hypothetical protein